jgi:hypothetical protein
MFLVSSYFYLFFIFLLGVAGALRNLTRIILGFKESVNIFIGHSSVLAKRSNQSKRLNGILNMISLSRFRP